MNATTLADLQAMLPGDWKLKNKIRSDDSYWNSETITLQAESERFNVVLEGSWPWILQRVLSYTLSPKQGGA